MKIETRIVYIAHDGKEFETKEQCEQHEREQTIPGLRTIIDREDSARMIAVNRKNHLKRSTLPFLEKRVKEYSIEIDKALKNGAYKLTPQEIVNIRALMNKLYETKATQAARVNELSVCRLEIRKRHETILKIQNKIKELEEK